MDNETEEMECTCGRSGDGLLPLLRLKTKQPTVY